MATVTIYNNDVQGALRALKKELQKEGVFRLTKARKNFKNNREKAKERLDEIVRRKIKDKHESKANSAYNGVNEMKPQPFIFKLENYIIKVYDNGNVGVYTLKNKKVNELMLDKADFDDIDSLVKATKAKIQSYDNQDTAHATENQDA